MPADNQRQRLFISYSRRDWPCLKYLVRTLEHHFVVVTDASVLRPGQRWKETIEQLIEGVDLFVVIVTRSSVMSHHVNAEVTLANSLNKAIIPLILEDAAQHPTLTQFHYIDARRSLRKAKDELIQYNAPDLSIAKPAQYGQPLPGGWFSGFRKLPAPPLIKLTVVFGEIGAAWIVLMSLALAVPALTWIGILGVALLRLWACVRLMQRRLPFTVLVLGYVMTLLIAINLIVEAGSSGSPSPALPFVLLLVAFDTLPVLGLLLLPAARAWMPASSDMPAWSDLVRKLKSLWFSSRRRN